ncbi:MAG: leucine-rich repeat domain-containing protein, partial [Deltaproteobacteria bacterium]|nr:leucine-rich repeat domain-containing protein [Deltaproteobacteria bacterium]
MDNHTLIKIIDQAAREGWTELDLYNKGLTRLPPEIGQLKKLRVLQLGRNKLTDLPEAIGRLTSLESLMLHGNKLVVLPHPIYQLTNLSFLFLYDCALEELSPEISK